MRSELWLWLAYFAIVIGVIGGIYIRYRQKQARLDDVSYRAAMLTPRQRTGSDVIDPRRARPAGCTVYWSREAIKEKIIAEYDASRTTVMRLRPDPAELARVWSLARRVGQNDKTVSADLILQGHESAVSRDLDSSCQIVSLPVTRDAVFKQLDGLRKRLGAGPDSAE